MRPLGLREGLRALAVPSGLPPGEARRGLPRRKKGCVPLCAPVVDRGKVERERGVTAASLATAFSHRAKWCPRHLLPTLPCYCVVLAAPSGLPPGETRSGLKGREKGCAPLPRRQVCCQVRRAEG